MKSHVSLETALEYKEVFNGTETVEELLSDFGYEFLLKVSSYFLGFIGPKSKYRDNKEFIQHFFSEENAEFAESVYKRILDLQKEYGRKSIIINRISSLQLFEYALSNLEREHKLHHTESEIRLFKAYLILNQQNNESASGLTEQTDKLDEEIRFPATNILLSFAQNDIVNYYTREIIVPQVIKSILLFEHLEADPKAQQLLKAFYEYYECEDWRDYLNSLLPLIFICYKRTKEAHTDLVLNQDDSDFEKNSKFLSKLALSENVIDDSYDFLKIRSNPIYKVDDTLYRVIFELFLFELLHTGLYFKLSEINQGLGSGKVIKQFRSYYCDEFSEKSLFYSVLDRIYRSKHKCFSGEEIKKFGIDAEPDYYIRNGGKIYLFESKDVLIPAKIKGSYDFDLLESSLKRKLYFDEKENGKIKPKAVLQLVKNIRRLLEGEFKFDSNFKHEKARIYPILILHHRQFDSAGLNKIVQHWFSREIQKLEKEGISTKRIMPITLINIDTLILYQDLFISNKWRLDRLISDYHRITTFPKNKKIRSEAQLVDLANRTMIPFSHFVVNILRNSKHPVHGPELLLEKGFELFNNEN